MSPSRTCSPATIPVGSLSYSQAPTYSAWPSVRIRTSVRSVTGAPSCSSRCTKPVTGVASSHAGSVRRPSTTGGVTTACAVAVGPWRAQSDDSRTASMECQEAGIERAAQQAPPLLGSSAGALAKARPGGGATKIAAGACRTAFELPLLGSLAQRSKRQDRGGATRRAASECAAALEGAPPGIEPGLPDPELTRAGLFGGHHVRKWWPAKHRRPQAYKVMPGLARRNACKTLVTTRRRPWLGVRKRSRCALVKHRNPAFVLIPQTSN